MSKPQNSYESFKSDVKETGTALYLVGGMILLVIILLSALIATLQSGLNGGTKMIIVSCLLITMGLLIFSPNFRKWVIGSWLLLLAAIPLLLVLYIGVSLIYHAITGHYLVDPNIFANR